MPLDGPRAFLLNRVVGDQPLGRVVAYHGTRTSALKSILDNGILAHPFRRYHPSRFYAGERGASVYVTENPDVARTWALSEVDDPSEVTILQVELPSDRLVPDEEATEAERFVGDVPAAWIRAAYPLRPDGSLGPAIKFPAGETPDDPCRRLVAVRHAEPGAMDALAMDRATFKPLPSQRSKVDRGSVRDKTEDGHLHVRTSHISKATVNPYLGEEIPGWEQLGLDPAKKYLLLRHPDELKKAAGTFNNLPILAQHVPITSKSHRADLVIGSTGTDAVYNHPHLDNSLVFWPQPAIDAIEDEELKELSCAYHYDPVMTPGEYEGQRYDGIMTNLRGNHVALVRDGRAGSDVVVGDSKEGIIMPKLTPAGLAARVALFTYLTPKLAQDSRGKVDLGPIVQGLTSKNYDSRRAPIAASVREQMKGHLAQDADLGDLDNLLDALKGDVESADGMVLDPNGGVPLVKKKEGEDGEEEDTVAKIKAYLKEEGVSDDIIANLDSFVAEGPPAGETDPNALDEDPDDEDERRRRAAANDGITPGEQEEPVTKTAMDAALKKVARDTEERVLRTQREIREAERFVQPWVGEVPLAMDSATSAEDVYRFVLKALDVDGADTMHRDALRPVLAAQPQPGAALRQPRPIAQDSAATVKSFNERFPNAGKVRFG